MQTIKVFDIVGDGALSSEHGYEIYNSIFPLLLSGEQITLDFSDVKYFCSHFCSAALGQLCKDFSREELRKVLSLKNVTPDGRYVMKRCMDHAWETYNDPDYMRKSIEALLNGELND